MKFVGFLILTVLVVLATLYIKKYITKLKDQDKIRPAHYKKNGKECIEAMEEQFGHYAVYNFCTLNAFKYRWRAGSKAGESYDVDIKKAEWYENYAKKLTDKDKAIGSSKI